MPPKRRLAASAAANWLAFAATLGVGFFLAPYLVRKLGDGRYGAWTLLESLIAYLTLFDLGIAACAVRFVARFRAAGDADALNRLASTCLLLFAGLGLAAFALGAALIPAALPWLTRSGLDEGEALAFALILLANLAATLPLSLFPAVLDGAERFAAASAVRVAFLTVRTTALVVLVESAPSLLGLGLVLTASNLLEHAALAVLAYKAIPGLRLSPRLADRASLRLVRGYSVDAFLAMLAGRACVQTGPVVVGAALTVVHVTWFGLSLKLAEFAKALLRSATNTLTPAFSALEAAGDAERTRRLFLTATRYALYLMLPVEIGLLAFGRPFLARWLGDGAYADRCYAALAWLASPLGLVAAQSIAARVLYGTGRLKWFARLACAEAVLNVGLGLALVGPFGVVGVAAGAALPSVLACVAAVGMGCTATGTRWRDYVVTGWLGPLAAAAVPAGVWATRLVADDVG